MEIKKLASPDLLNATKTLASEERRITTEILRHLLEIESRRLFAEMGYPSLFEFCTRELKYSDAAAYRRISAMRLLRDMPEVESKIAAGNLSVTNASLLQSFFKAARKGDKSFSVEEKQDLLKQVEGKSTRECEKVFAAIAPQILILPQEKERVISASETEIRFIADEELMRMFKQVRELCAHKLQGKTDYASLLKMMAELVLKKVDPEKKPVRNPSVTKSSTPAPEVICGTATSSGVSPQRGTFSRYIPAAVKQAVWKRDKGTCQYTDPATGRKCGSKYGLQYDHLKPYALNGETTLENLRLLCRPHNALMAAKVFGYSKIESIIAQDRRG